jgi:hypothetical protein
MVAAVVPKAKQARLDVATRLKVRNLYLVQNLSYNEIAAQTGLSYNTVNSFVRRTRLADARKQIEAQSLKRHDARTHAFVDATAEAIAAQSEEIALGGLNRARDSVVSGSEYAAKDFQAWTGGVRNLVQVSRIARGEDNSNGSGSTSLTVNAYVVRCEAAQPKPEPKQVEQAQVVELSPVQNNVAQATLAEPGVEP